MQEKILVLDFGSQYNQLIARRVREIGVYSELVRHDITSEEIEEHGNVIGVILSGGPNSVYDETAIKPDAKIFDLDIPILGVCYGMQYIAHHFGGNVISANSREYGKKEISTIENSMLFSNTPTMQNVWMSHGDHVESLTDDFIITAKSDTTDIIAFEAKKLKLFGLQFHPEVTNSEYGFKILTNFVRNICEAESKWTMNNFIEEQVKVIKETVGDKHVICGLSGGVDSAVVAALISKAIGSQLTCIFVDHGMLRKNEGDLVMQCFEKDFNLNVIKIDAKEHFLKALENVENPELKRKIIGKEFISMFEDAKNNLLTNFDVGFLAQGTLYTDIIESGHGTSQMIKSHHNVGGLPKNMKLKLLEPVKTLFKDEVRELGTSLGLEKQVVWRQPFPGPGLAIRIIGDVTEEKLQIVSDSDAILQEVIKENGLDREIWQYFTVLTNLKSVGVMGDQRTYDYTLAIRAVNSIDGMTADFAKIDWDILQQISVRIVNEVRGVNRIVYDITSKPPATIEWE